MSFALPRPPSLSLSLSLPFSSPPTLTHPLCAPFTKTLTPSLSSSSTLSGGGVWGFGQKLPSRGGGIVLLLNGQFYPPLLLTVNEK